MYTCFVETWNSLVLDQNCFPVLNSLIVFFFFQDYPRKVTKNLLDCEKLGDMSKWMDTVPSRILDRDFRYFTPEEQKQLSEKKKMLRVLNLLSIKTIGNTEIKKWGVSFIVWRIKRIFFINQYFETNNTTLAINKNWKTAFVCPVPMANS